MAKRFTSPGSKHIYGQSAGKCDVLIEATGAS
jgi:hypothetical protein